MISRAYAATRQCRFTGSTSNELGIPYWPMNTVLTVPDLNTFISRLENTSCRAQGSIYARLLRACANANALEQGRRVHRHIQIHADDCSTFFANRLLTMYSKCGSIDEARWVFDQMRERDVVSWTAMITAYAQNGQMQRQALELYKQMDQKPNRVTFLSILTACDAPEFLVDGEKIHTQIMELGLESEVAIGNALMSMYSRCERIQGAMFVFERMPERDVITWNTAITANAQCGHRILALVLLKRMLLEGVSVDKVTFISALNACTGPSFLRDGELIHRLVIEKQIDYDVVLGTALVAMYGRCGYLLGACELFKRMPERNVISWNAMIAAYAQCGRFQQAIEHYKRMEVEPTRVTYLAILNAITTPEALAEGKQIHERIVREGFHTLVDVANSLIAMYGRCGVLEDSRRVFESLRSSRDVVTWNAMLSAYTTGEHNKEAIYLFQTMKSEKVVPNKVTFLTVLSACTNLVDLESGKLVYEFSVECGFGGNVSVNNAMMHLYITCGSVQGALSIFEHMELRDVISWNTIIAGSEPRWALFTFRRMQLEGQRPTQVTFMSVLSTCSDITHARLLDECVNESTFWDDSVMVSCIVNMYGKCGELVKARGVFDAHKRTRTLATWNTMITAYATRGCSREAFALFEQMELDRVTPDRVTYIAVLSACTSAASLPMGRRIHERAVEAGFESDVMVRNTLVNMYSKCGRLESAREIFERIPNKDVFSWNGIVTGYAQNGEVFEALKLSWLMQQSGVRPDTITFMVTLSVCSHAGLVARGVEEFVSMVEDHGLRRSIEHYSCVVDMLGRAGRVAEAEYFAKRAAENCDVSWMALLAACDVHGDVERAKRVAGGIVDKHPDNPAAYVALSNLYAATTQG